MNPPWNRIGAGLFAAISLLGFSNLSAADFKVATSIYPGWMDNWLMEMKLDKGEPSFLEKRLKETGKGAGVKIEKFKEYIPSIEALVAGKVDACTMTLGEALAFPADSGVPVVILLGSRLFQRQRRCDGAQGLGARQDERQADCRGGVFGLPISDLSLASEIGQAHRLSEIEKHPGR